jgi:aminoglycoside phosphotransferase (APT) family kinase protein
VPAVLAQGSDFLRLEYVPHSPLEPCAAHARALGQALAEIHARTFAQSGELGADLSVRLPFDDFVDALTSYAERSLASSELSNARDLAPSVRRFFDRHRSALRDSAGPSVLLHGDFKVSNLHWAGDRLLVLDWEFCYAGSALMDIGQLLRWALPDEFVAEFAAAYRESGGRLEPNFRAASQRFDLVNLAGLLQGTTAGSQRERDVSERIRRTLTESS